MRISERGYAVMGLAHSSTFSVNAGFFCGRGETAVVDSGFCALSAHTILGYARSVAPHNGARYLINTRCTGIMLRATACSGAPAQTSSGIEEYTAHRWIWRRSAS